MRKSLIKISAVFAAATFALAGCTTEPEALETATDVALPVTSATESTEATEASEQTEIEAEAEAAPEVAEPEPFTITNMDEFMLGTWDIEGLIHEFREDGYIWMPAWEFGMYWGTDVSNHWGLVPDASNLVTANLWIALDLHVIYRVTANNENEILLECLKASGFDGESEYEEECGNPQKGTRIG